MGWDGNLNQFENKKYKGKHLKEYFCTCFRPRTIFDLFENVSSAM